MEPLSDKSMRQYLELLGVSRNIEPDRDNLNTLIRLHLERVPFENLDYLLGRDVSLDTDAILTKVTHQGRGGSCFELNCLFGKLLQALGYRVRLRAARLLLPTTDDLRTKVPLSHVALLVQLSDEGDCLVDVGKAVVGMDRALPLRGGDTSPFRVREVGRTGTLELSVPTKSSGGRKVCFTLEPYDLEWVDVIPLTWYSSTYPESPMKCVLLAGRRCASNGCWLQLVRDRFLWWSCKYGILEKRIMKSEDKILEVLQTVFKLRLSPEEDIQPLRLRLCELLPSWRLRHGEQEKKLSWPEC